MFQIFLCFTNSGREDSRRPPGWSPEPLLDGQPCPLHAFCGKCWAVCLSRCCPRSGASAQACLSLGRETPAPWACPPFTLLCRAHTHMGSRPTHRSSPQGPTCPDLLSLLWASGVGSTPAPHEEGLRPGVSREAHPSDAVLKKPALELWESGQPMSSVQQGPRCHMVQERLSVRPRTSELKLEPPLQQVSAQAWCSDPVLSLWPRHFREQDSIWSPR